MRLNNNSIRTTFLSTYHRLLMLSTYHRLLLPCSHYFKQYYKVDYMLPVCIPHIMVLETITLDALL